MIEVQRRRREGVEPPLAPLVDVVFILLLFFTVTASFAELGIQLDLPGAATAESDELRELRVSIDTTGRVYVDATEVALAELGVALAARRAAEPRAEVSLEADRAVPYGVFVRVLDTLRATGYADVRLATGPDPVDPPPGSPP